MPCEDLLAFEATALVQSLQKLALKDVGSVKWSLQHEAIETLNIQAHKNVIAQTEEFITEAILTYEKVGLFLSVRFMC
jgi:hypothetical protein